MKTTTRSLPTVVTTLAVLLLAAALSGCGNTAPESSTTPAHTAPAVASPANTLPAPAEPAVQTADAFPSEGYDLSHPEQGLDTIGSYRQTLEITLRGTLDGSPYEETQYIQRQVAGADSSLAVRSDATGGRPVRLFDAFLENEHYSQDTENSSCRATPIDGNTAPHPDLARKLPAAFGITEAGREPYHGVSAMHYVFDEKSLPQRDGGVQAAEGEVWLAEGGGAVVGYTLTVEMETGGFRGTRTWAYRLEPEAVVQLPAACQPVLSGLPVLPGAADTVNLPGFQRYYAGAGRAEAVAFYFDELTGLGWQALPGSAPDQADLESEFTVLSYAQPYGAGGRVLVIQVAEMDGRLQVVLQSALTRQPVQADVSGTPSDEESETEEESQPPQNANQPLLPDDLPEIPGATVITRMDNFVMLDISDSAEAVTAFYTEALTAAGWTLEQEIENAGMTILRWSRDSNILSITLMPQGSSLQVAIAALE